MDVRAIFVSVSNEWMGVSSIFVSVSEEWKELGAFFSVSDEGMEAAYILSGLVMNE